MTVSSQQPRAPALPSTPRALLLTGHHLYAFSSSLLRSSFLQIRRNTKSNSSPSFTWKAAHCVSTSALRPIPLAPTYNCRPPHPTTSPLPPGCVLYEDTKTRREPSRAYVTLLPSGRKGVNAVAECLAGWFPRDCPGLLLESIHVLPVSAPSASLQLPSLPKI